MCKTAFLAMSIVGLWMSAPAMTQGRSDSSPGQWSPQKARAWYDRQPWPCGFNYVPANAISYTEMWMDYAFDPQLIDSELALAQKTGFNCLRIILPYVVWEYEPAAFRQRFETFLRLCDKNGLKAMPIFFDDCQFGPITDPVYGKQPDVVEGWYANGWTPSPGHSMVRDASTWPKLERFVADVVGRFKNDPRILCWDLYNEPTNSGLGDVSIPLVEQVFQWARRVCPDQPLTVGIWNGNQKLNRVIIENSDIVTFHDYTPADHLADQMAVFSTLGRPMICTEWLNRGIHSAVETCLPLFYDHRVGCLHWGLVNGKTQTDLNWGHQPGNPEPLVWQHDLYHPDHTPYAPVEIQLFDDYIRAARRADPVSANIVTPVLATSELVGQTWRYTTTPPSGLWTAVDYEDAEWTVGQGGFGTAGIAGLNVGTEWRSGQIWLRKTFVLNSTDFSNVYFRLFHDEAIEIYINGQPVQERAGWTTGYIEMPVLRDKMHLFRKGQNVIAIHCRQTSGAQGVDIGIIDRPTL